MIHMQNPPENVDLTSDTVDPSEKSSGLLSQLRGIRPFRVLLWSAIVGIPAWAGMEYGVRQGIELEQGSQRRRSEMLLQECDTLAEEATKFLADIRARNEKDPNSLTRADYDKLREFAFKFSKFGNMHVEWFGKDTGQSTIKIVQWHGLLEIAKKELKSKLPAAERKQIDEQEGKKKEEKKEKNGEIEKRPEKETKPRKPTPKSTRGTQVG